MNKKELIKYFEDLPYVSITQMGKKSFIDLIEQLDEPEKVKVPQFVADFISEQKKQGHTLSYSIDASMFDRVAEWYWGNSELFARAWLDGYEIEKEMRYQVKMKAIKSNSQYLVFGELSETWWFGSAEQIGNVKSKHTRKEIEDAGFGEVFNSPLFEVEEVME